MLPRSDAAPLSNACISVVRVRDVHRGMAGLGADAAIAGPCAYYAAFGQPGTRIASWLASRDFAFALSSNWRGEQYTHPTGEDLAYRLAAWLGGYSAVAGTTLDARKCWLGDRAACEATMIMATSESAGWRHTRGVYDGSVPWNNPWGSHEARVLADMRREFGSEAFGRFWTSSEAPTVAFQQVTGRSMGDWTYEMVQRVNGRTSAGARVPASAFVWGLLVAVGCVTLAAGVSARRTVR
jgi:hypothetical protein